MSFVLVPFPFVNIAIVSRSSNRVARLLPDLAAYVSPRGERDGKPPAIASPIPPRPATVAWMGRSEHGGARARETWEFQGDARFEVRRRLGSGSFGAVFEVFDSVRDARVALKLLRGSSEIELRGVMRLACGGVAGVGLSSPLWWPGLQVIADAHAEPWRIERYDAI